ncbi:MAG: monovalent cation:proton antiporter-2 (CPA2) family protein, partial [Candidatus Thiodiazotropha sp.]
MNAEPLFQTLTLLAAAVLIVPLFQFLRLGTVLGFLVAGMLIGPAGFGLITEVDAIRHLAELGVVFLLFIIGIELKPSRLWLMRRQVFGMGTTQVIATGVAITLIVAAFGVELRVALVLGLGLALSSTAFVLQILTERRELATGYGRAAFAILLLQDLAVVPLLALVPLLATPESSLSGDLGLAVAESVGMVLLVIVIGRYLLRPVLHQVASHGAQEIFLATGLLLVLGTATLIEHAGMSMAMGAFLAGLLIADSEFRHQIMADIQPFRAILLGLFFMSVGMSVDLG